MLKKLFTFTVLSFFVLIPQIAIASPIELKSPNGELKISIELKDGIFYNVSYGQDLLLQNCTLQMDLQNEILGANPKLIRQKRMTINEEIKREFPMKNAFVKNNCNVLQLDFKKDFSVEFRAFDDGIAYRFITHKKSESIVKNEELEINFPHDYFSDLSLTGSFNTAYENPYSHIKTSEYKESDRMTTLPVLLEAGKNYKILISEADLFDYPCMFLKSTGKNGLVSTFPKCPLEFGDDGDRSVKILKEADYIAKTKGARNFPWRLFVITKDDKQLLENEMVYKLSTPNVLGDISWVKPGQVSWDWWNGTFSPYGVDFKTGCNMSTYKYYIDFSSKY
jgi:alpha-glucosidase